MSVHVLKITINAETFSIYSDFSIFRISITAGDNSVNTTLE